MTIHVKQSLWRIAARLFRPGAVAFRRSVWVVCLAAATACSKDPLLPDGPSDKPSAATVSFSVEPLDDVGLDTRAGATPINDLWVLQARPDGVLVGKNYLDVANNSRVHIPVVSVDEPCTFLFVANTDVNMLYADCDNLEAAQAKPLLRSLPKQGPDLVLQGTRTCLPSELNGATVSLKHAQAKLSLRLAVDTGEETFTLYSVRVVNFSTLLCPGRLSELNPGTDPDKTYPTYAYVQTDKNSLGLRPDHATPLSATPVDWGSVYLYENARGTGTATDPKQKTAATALRGQGDYATCVQINGYLTSAKTENPQGCSYTIYLGSNLTNDYNILRGRHYVLTVTIKGADQYDARITYMNPGEDWKGNYYTTQADNSVCRYDGEDLDVDLTWTQAMDACPIGWRLPTMKELEILLCMKSKVYGAADGFYDAHYWTGTPSATNSNDAYSVHMGSGWVGVTNKNERFRVRCVRDNNVQAQRYPYVTNNSSGKPRVIVCRAGGVGLKDALSTNTSPRWYSGVAYGSEKYPPRLEISDQQVPWWSLSAVDKLPDTDPCARLNTNGQTGWRLPTQCELRLVVAFRNEVGLEGILANRDQKNGNACYERQMLSRTLSDDDLKYDASVSSWRAYSHKFNDSGFDDRWVYRVYEVDVDGTTSRCDWKKYWGYAYPNRWQILCVRPLS